MSRLHFPVGPERTMVNGVLPVLSETELRQALLLVSVEGVERRHSGQCLATHWLGCVWSGCGQHGYEKRRWSHQPLLCWRPEDESSWTAALPALSPFRRRLEEVDGALEKGRPVSWDFVVKKVRLAEDRVIQVVLGLEYHRFWWFGQRELRCYQYVVDGDWSPVPGAPVPERVGRTVVVRFDFKVIRPWHRAVDSVSDSDMFGESLRLLKVNTLV
ncbi:hypothetical protein LZ30DRAFT_724187 [Colletotrichum cereale]|nr:hypothetical protein LZ30DRAFT_724187 [Colletotrichum cereale]